MSIAQWQAAFRRYQVAAAILGQWSLGGSWAHVEICSQIAASASTHRRRADLAVLYDEMARRARARERPPAPHPLAAYTARRKQWAEKLRAGEVGFTLESECRRLDTSILRLVCDAPHSVGTCGRAVLFRRRTCGTPM